MGCWSDGPESNWAVASKGMKSRGELNAASAYLKCITGTSGYEGGGKVCVYVSFLTHD